MPYFFYENLSVYSFGILIEYLRGVGRWKEITLAII